LQLLPVVVAWQLGQGKTVNRGTLNGNQIGVIGLDSWITGLAELFGGEGMDDADFEASGGKSTLRGVKKTPYSRLRSAGWKKQ
jgi:hypothetical protein